MSNKFNSKYDVIIIGAGIGGLVCGCYLAKAGLNVLIIEHSQQVGGYCTSFKRKGFVFDSAVHSLGSCRPTGLVSTVLNELDLSGKLKIHRKNPSDIVAFSKDEYYCFFNDIRETTEELSKRFYTERKKIFSFLNFLKNSSPLDFFSKLKYKTFDELITNYFTAIDLKNIFRSFLASFQVSSSKAAAISCALLFKEFIIDGGYYPQGGMQSFSNLFASCFQKYGGNILCSTRVTKILVEHGKTKGVIFNDEVLLSRCVISGADAIQTYLTLLNKDIIPSSFRKILTQMRYTASGFIVYLSLTKKPEFLLNKCMTLWYYKNKNPNRILSKLSEYKMEKKGFVLFASPTNHDETLAPRPNSILQLIFGMPYHDEKYWKIHKEKIADLIIHLAEDLAPQLSNIILDKYIATPHTFYKYTLNHKGAFRGWQAIPSQISPSLISQESFIKGLYLVGHWTTQPGQGGIPTVMYSARTLSKRIISRLQ